MTLSNDLIMVETETRDLGDPVGFAVYAAEPIPAGTVVAVYGGTAIDAERFRSLPDEVQSYSLQVDDDVYLVTATPTSAATLINHSCDPSCRLDGQIVLVAARDIAVGEPLTYDYATSDSSPYDEFECQCGTAVCRRKVTGDDWMDPLLQRRYEGWFSPYLARKIEALAAAERDPSGGLVNPPSTR